MAFIRKKGNYYYLVMSYRDDDGKVRQKVLSYLGKEPEINDEVKDEVKRKFPDVDIDWSSIEGTTISMDLDEDMEDEEDVVKMEEVEDLDQEEDVEDLEEKEEIKEKEKIIEEDDSWLEWD